MKISFQEAKLPVEEAFEGQELAQEVLFANQILQGLPTQVPQGLHHVFSIGGCVYSEVQYFSLRGCVKQTGFTQPIDEIFSLLSMAVISSQVLLQVIPANLVAEPNSPAAQGVHLRLRLRPGRASSSTSVDVIFRETASQLREGGKFKWEEATSAKGEVWVSGGGGRPSQTAAVSEGGGVLPRPAASAPAPFSGNCQFERLFSDAQICWDTVGRWSWR